MSRKKKKHHVKKKGADRRPSGTPTAPKHFWLAILDTNKIIAGGTVALVLVAIAAIYFSNRSSTEELHRTHRPQIVFTRPMEVEGMSCSTDGTENGENVAWAGRPHVFLKNIGNADATKVFVAFYPYGQKLVPFHKTGNPALDDWPLIDDTTCQQQLTQNMRLASFPIYSGKEWVLNDLVQDKATSQPPFGKDAAVGLVWVWCFGYSDEYGLQHATCTTFVFRPSSGENFFVCGKPVTGSFQFALQGHCEN